MGLPFIQPHRSNKWNGRLYKLLDNGEALDRIQKILKILILKGVLIKNPAVASIYKYDDKKNKRIP